MQHSSIPATAPKKSFARWCAFAFFRWHGVIYRKEYIKGFLILYFISQLVYLGAVYAHLQGAGLPTELKALMDARRAGVVPSYVLLPFLAMQIMLDAKRLRSMETFPFLAVVFNLMQLIPLPEGNTLASNIISIATYVYLFSLALFPPKTFTLAKTRGPSAREVKIYGWRAKEKADESTIM